MATKAINVTYRPNGQRNAVTAVWSNLTQSGADDGVPFEGVDYAERSVAVSGTLGAAGSVRIEGSNDGVNYFALTDPQGNDLNITALKVEAVTELTRFIRPKVTAGDGTTDLTVTMFARRQG